jgi:hypothetical protein
MAVYTVQFMPSNVSPTNSPYRIDRPLCLENPRPQGEIFPLPPISHPHFHAEPKQPDMFGWPRPGIEVYSATGEPGYLPNSTVTAASNCESLP